MPEMLKADIVQQYQDTLIAYKGVPYKVKYIGDKLRLLNLKTSRCKDVEFSLENFSPIQARLGYVNIDNAAIFIERKPVRQYQVGLSYSNCVFHTVDVEHPFRIRDISERLGQFESPEISDMFSNKYPTLETAIDIVQKQGGSIAFDRQFAICKELYVYYKCKNVGRVLNNKIVFKTDCEHLSFALGNKYGNNSEIICKETA